MIIIHDDINPRRPVRGPGLQGVVGRVPSRSGTFGVLYKSLLMTLAAAGALAFSAQAAEVDQLKSDLIGQCMGGREKCWKFQAVDQIKELVIKNKTEDAQKRVYIISLKLQATAGSGKYTGEARVEYTRARTGWKIKQVGLLSLAKIE